MKPNQNRGCTDLFCLLIFLVFTAGTSYIAFYSFNNGDPNRVATPYDPDHKPCGTGDRQNFPLIYFVAPSTNTLWRTVCVKSCPVTGEEKRLECFPNSVVKQCDAKVSSDMNQAVLVYKSKPYGNRVCLPDSEQYLKQISSTLDTEEVQQFASDLQVSKNVILISIAIAIVIGFFFLLFIRLFAGSLVFGFLVGIVVGFAGIGFKFYQLSQSGQDQFNAGIDPQQYKYVAFGCFGLAGLLGLAFFCLRSKIALAVVTLKVATAFIFDNLSIFFIPIGMVIACVGYFIYWLGVAIYLYSCGTISQKEKSLPFGQFEFDEKMKYFGYAHIFSLLWNMALIVGSAQFIESGVASLWFCYSKNRKNETGEEATNNFTLTSIKYLVRYHLGSVVFGSLLVALLDSLRIILHYIDEQTKQAQGKDGNNIIGYVLKCCICCVSCFECFLKYINKSAYVFVFVNSEGFFPSCKEVFSMLFSDGANMAILAGLGNIFEFLGSLTISLLTTFISYQIIQKTPEYSEAIHNIEVPLACIFIISLLIGTYFMGLFGNSADTLIILYNKAYKEKDVFSIPELFTDLAKEVGEIASQQVK